MHCTLWHIYAANMKDYHFLKVTRQLPRRVLFLSSITYFLKKKNNKKNLLHLMTRYGFCESKIKTQRTYTVLLMFPFHFILCFCVHIRDQFTYKSCFVGSWLNAAKWVTVTLGWSSQGEVFSHFEVNITVRYNHFIVICICVGIGISQDLYVHWSKLCQQKVFRRIVGSDKNNKKDHWVFLTGVWLHTQLMSIYQELKGGYGSLPVWHHIWHL